MTNKYLTLNATTPFAAPLYLLIPKGGPRAAVEQAVAEGVDLSFRVIDVDLTAAHLEGIVAMSSVFAGSLENAKLSKGHFSRSTFNGSLKGATAHGADFSTATMTATDLTGLQAHDADFRSCNLRGANLTRASVKRSLFMAAQCARATTQDMDVEAATISRAHIDHDQLKVMATPFVDIEFHALNGRTRAEAQAAEAQAQADGAGPAPWMQSASSTLKTSTN